MWWVAVCGGWQCVVSGSVWRVAVSRGLQGVLSGNRRYVRVCNAVCCSVLQCAAVCCSVLQCVAVSPSVSTSSWSGQRAACGSVQGVAVSIVQYVVVSSRW